DFLPCPDPLPADAGSSGTGRELVSLDARGAEALSDWDIPMSREKYLGYESTDNFASPGGIVLDTPHVYTAPTRLQLNHWALSGEGTVDHQSVTLNSPSGRIAYRFHARELNLSMDPPTGGNPVPFRVLIDGQPPGAAHGVGVDALGNGTVTGPNTYPLIRKR